VKPHSPGPEYKTAPLVVLNNFPTDEANKLAAVMFQNLFPPLNVQTMQLADCKRVVLLSYTAETKIIEFRHYLIKTSAVGITKSVKKIIRAQIPKLEKFEDIADYVLGNNAGSDSEAELGPESRIELPNDNPKSTVKTTQSAVRLTELGPRMQLQLIKIEEDFCTGNVIFHEYVKKTPEEIEELKKKKDEQAKLKQQRKLEQEKKC